MLLQEYLSNEDPTIRGIVISAFRYTLSDSRDAYNDVLRPLIVPLLVSMLSDRDLGNHRLALTTLNSAIHNKMDIILPHLSELLPVVIGDTHIKPELIREVQMGPFKHKVDDGLELRKVRSIAPVSPSFCIYPSLYMCFFYCTSFTAVLFVRFTTEVLILSQLECIRNALRVLGLGIRSCPCVRVL
jgi:hypothetical protein